METNKKMKMIPFRLITLISAAIVMLFLPATFVKSAHAGNENVKVSWGTDGINGTGGYVTPHGSGNNGATISLSDGDRTFTVSPSSSPTQYVLDKVEYKRGTSNFTTLDTDKINFNNNTFVIDIDKTYEIKVYFALANVVTVNWGSDITGTNGVGGYVALNTTQPFDVPVKKDTDKTFRIYPDNNHVIDKVEYKKKTDATWSALTVTTNNGKYYVTFKADSNYDLKVYFKADLAYVTVTWGSDAGGSNGLGGYVNPPCNPAGTSGAGAGLTCVSDSIIGYAKDTKNIVFNIYEKTGFTISKVSISKNNNNFYEVTDKLVVNAAYSTYTISDIKDDSYQIKVYYKETTGGGSGVNILTFWGTDSLATNFAGGYVNPPATALLDTPKPSGAIDTPTNVNIAKDTKKYKFKIYPAAGFHIKSVTLKNMENDKETDQTKNLDNKTGYYEFQLDNTSDHDWKLWVIFEADSGSWVIKSQVVDPADPTLQGANGTIAPPDPASAVGGNVSVSDNGSQKFTMVPAVGYIINDVLIDNDGTVGNGSVGAVKSYTFKNVKTNHSIRVSFKKQDYVITVISGANGYISPGAITESTTGTVNVSKASEQIFAISPKIGYRILDVKVKENGSSTYVSKGAISSYTFTNISGDGVIEATFALATVSTCTYCQTPAFIASGTTLLPNVLIIFDNSGSMARAAYSGSTHVWDKSYYGYFDPTKVYKIVDSVYVVDDSFGPPDPADENQMSGNYLNWSKMARVDVVRKALIGGKVDGGTAARNGAGDKILVGENVKVNVGTTKPTGIVQAFEGKVRFGVMFFGSYDSGGKFHSGIGGHLAANMLSSTENLVEILEGTGSDPSGATPLAESLYESIRFFQGAESAYNYNVNYSSVDPVEWSCQKHFVLVVTDGLPNEAAILPGRNNATAAVKLDTAFDAEVWYGKATAAEWGTGESNQKSYLGAVSYYAHNTDLRTGVAGTLGTNKDQIQNLTIYGIYAFGSASGSQALKAAGKYGGYKDIVINGIPDGDCLDNIPATEWCQSGNGKPDNYLEAGEGASLETSIMTAMDSIMADVSSGTAASILSNSEGSGANLLQAVFYPNKIFKNGTQVDWIGEMQNLWYYVDPFIDLSTVREDTDFPTTAAAIASGVNQEHILELKKDYAARFYFDLSTTKTFVELKQDNDGNGSGDTVKASQKDPDDVNSIWRAGKKLWAKSAASRTIHTSLDGKDLFYPSKSVDGTTVGGFYYDSTIWKDDALKYLQAASADEASKIINYVRGADQDGYRVRKVDYASTPPATGYVSNIWKLGDIISSTPRIQSSIKLNSFNMEYPVGYSDKSYGAFISKDSYKKRGMVYVGANDGMLHAFKLGKLTVSGNSDISGVKVQGDVKATLTGTNLGEEQWAYIPRNALPYLKYLGDKDNYKHLYYVDGSTTLADVSIAKPSGCTSDYWNCQKDNTDGTNWKTVLIGSMGLGGATRKKGDPCAAGTKTGICVTTPIFDPADATNETGLGYSSYFALDITNQYYDASGVLAEQPSLKWEFSHPDLGYSTSGVAIVRINAQKPVVNGAGVVTSHTSDPSKNGRWYAVFASGPTGPIDGNERQFYGKSNQTLKIFVVDINATPPFVLNTNYWIIDTHIPNAFSGSITTAAIDTDRWDSSSVGNYQDDALYIGYTKAKVAGATLDPATDTWTEGGVIRVLTNDYKVNSASEKDMTPASWTWSKLIEGSGANNVGPVTSGVAKLQDRKNKKLWIYFGSGRFFSGADDKSSQRSIYGVQDGCYTLSNELDKDCTLAALSRSDLNNQSTSSVDASITEKGWYINLGAEDVSTQMGAERAITEPVAMTNGAVFFTTFKPTSNVCKFGGDSYLWGVDYKSGGEIAANAKRGKVLIQVSTGAFEEVSIKDALTAEGNRRLDTPMTGKPPADPPPVISNASNKPPKKILHLQEK